MTEGKFQLHGTRFLNREPTIDCEIDAVPPAFQVPTMEEVLQVSVRGYDRIRIENESIQLGKLAMRMLNTFFVTDPQRTGSITTPEIVKVWQAYKVEVSQPHSGPVLRAVEALNAIRQEIDGFPFVLGGARGSGRVSHYSISDDIVFSDTRFD